MTRGTMLSGTIKFRNYYKSRDDMRSDEDGELCITHWTGLTQVSHCTTISDKFTEAGTTDRILSLILAWMKLNV